MRVAGRRQRSGWTTGHPSRYPLVFMFSQEFHPRHFLHRLSGTAPFRKYCATRGIRLRQPGPAASRRRNLRLWADAISALPTSRREAVERELAQVNELSGQDATAHLVEAAGNDRVPPADIPAGPPLALWFLMHEPKLFREVLLHHEGETRPWRIARTVAGLRLDSLPRRAAALARAVGELFHAGAGVARYCVSEARRLGDAYCFTAWVADRPRPVETFTGGRLSLRHERPALTVCFAYEPCDGTVLLRAPVRSEDRAAELFRCFGRSVLGLPITGTGYTFDLDRLKLPFHPLPDAGDMEQVRVRALHLRYPARLARRLVRLETHTNDCPTAIEDLLRLHVVGYEMGSDDLRVAYAELQVRLRTHDGGRAHVIRLWPDRCSLDHTPFGRRLRDCLCRWGLTRG